MAEFDLNEVPIKDLISELYRRKNHIDDEVESLTQRQKEIFDELAIRLFLCNTHGVVPKNKYLRKQSAQDGFTADIFLLELAKNVVDDKPEPICHNKSVLIRTLLENYLAKAQWDKWTELVDTDPYKE